MHALPFLLALAVAAALAPLLLRRPPRRPAHAAQLPRPQLPIPFGVLTPAAALLALVPLR